MSAAHSPSETKWKWDNATAGAVAGFATVAAMHPLDVVRTRFQVNDGRTSYLPTYKNTVHASLTIARLEGLKGLYAGFGPAVLGSTVSWGLYFFFYGRAKQRYSKNRDDKLNPALHLVSAAEAGALVCFCTNPIWLVKTRLQLQNPHHQTRPYSGLHDALRTIMREEGWRALYKGIVPGLLLVSHGAIQFTAYEELRKAIVDYKSKERKGNCRHAGVDLLVCTDDIDMHFERTQFGIKIDYDYITACCKGLFGCPGICFSQNSLDYAVLGGSSKVAAIILTYPFQVIRSRLQQRPSTGGIPRYMDSWHVVKEIVRFEGFRGFYKGITPSLLKNVPASSITFIVYENILKLLKLGRSND